MTKIDELIHALDENWADAFIREKAHEALFELEALRWIPVEERLPDPGKVVWAWVKYSGGTRQVPIVAVWIPKFFREWDECDELLYPEYKDEGDETGYWPEGWYERVECWDALSSVAVWEPVTHWRELPTGPGGGS